MDTVTFFWNYATGLLAGWFILIGSLLTLNDVSGYATGRAWEWPRKHRLPIILCLLFFAQFDAYRALHERAGNDAASASAALSKLEAEVTSIKAAMLDKERQLQAKSEQIEELRLAAVRAPVPLDVRVRPAPPAGLLPTYILSDDAPSTFWPSFNGDWVNPEGVYKEVSVDWDDVPADTHAVAELKIVLLGGDGWGEVRLLDLTDGTVVAQTGRLTGTPTRDYDVFKQTLPLKTQTGRRRYVLQIRLSKDANLNVRGELVFVRKARWG